MYICIHRINSENVLYTLFPLGCLGTYPLWYEETTVINLVFYYSILGWIVLNWTQHYSLSSNSETVICIGEKEGYSLA